MVKITTDSTADLNDLFDKYDVSKIALAVNLGSNEFLDGETVSPQDIFKFVAEKKVLPKTAARSIEDYTEFFKQFTDAGLEIVHIGISSKLSASYDNAVKAAAELKGVYVVDGLSLSTGTGLLVLYAAELSKDGLSAKEISDKVAARVNAVQASFVVDTMEYLKKGGRCSGVTALVASVLKIKPSILLSEGNMIVGRKYMGSFEKSILKYVDYVFEMHPNPDLKRIFVTHSCAEKQIVDSVVNKIKSMKNFEEIIVTVAGSTITSHCGKGTLGILYFDDGAANKN